MRHFLLAVFSVLVLSPAVVCGDILFYPIPGMKITFVLQGQVSVLPGKIVTLRHPRFGKLHFGLENVRWYKVPTTLSLATRKLQKAVRDEDVEACIDAGRWALHHGLLPQFYEAASAAWKIDAEHPTVKKLAAMKRKIDTPLPEKKEREREMLEYLPVGDRMKFLRSKHFLLLHDTPAAKDPKTKSRARERMELLETVYESFLLKFCLEGFDIEVPEERLKVVLFSHKQEYLAFAASLKSDLSKASGFYTMKENIAIFFDQGTNEIFEALTVINGQLQAAKANAIKRRLPNAKNLVRFADTLQLLIRVSREELDIEVVSHEATHQLAANTGLMPNDAAMPLWAAEGLATYFEAPKQAAWGGIGIVNEERLKSYRELSGDTEHSNLDFVVSDQVFMRAANHETLVSAYGQAWALTHFLMDRHFDKLIEYYQLIAARKSEEQLSSEEYQEAFEQVFGDETTGLNIEWKMYMRGLKTDLELVLEEK